MLTTLLLPLALAGPATLADYPMGEVFSAAEHPELSCQGSRCTRAHRVGAVDGLLLVGFCGDRVHSLRFDPPLQSSAEPGPPEALTETWSDLLTGLKQQGWRGSWRARGMLDAAAPGRDVVLWSRGHRLRVGVQRRYDKPAQHYGLSVGPVADEEWTPVDAPLPGVWVWSIVASETGARSACPSGDGGSFPL